LPSAKVVAVCYPGYRLVTFPSKELHLTYKNLDYTVRDRVAEITMRRGPVNAIDHGLIEDINNAYRAAKADRGCGR